MGYQIYIKFLLVVLFSQNAFSAISVFRVVEPAELDVKATHLTRQRSQFFSKLPGVSHWRMLELSKSQVDLWETNSFKLPLQNRVNIKVEIVKKWWSNSGKLHINGEISSDRYGKAHLVFSEEGLSGHILAGGKAYSIAPVGEGYHVSYVQEETKKQRQAHHEALEKILPGTKYYEEAALSGLHSRDIAKGIDPKDASTLYNLKPRLKRDIQPMATSDNFVDVAFFYTDDTAAAYSDYESTIEAHVEYTNQALEDSCANYRIRNVHMEEVSYVETGDMSADLTCIRETSDACLDSIHTTRDTVGADLVELIVHTNTDYCGLAYVGAGTFPSSLGFSVKLSWCDGATMAHELGHNKGLMHDRYQQNLGPRDETVYSYGYGYSDLVNKTRTIMAYTDHCTDLGFSCDRVARFSNPRILDEGESQGIRNFTDSAKRLNETYSSVADFRESVSGGTTEVDNQCVDASAEEKDIHCFIATVAYDSYLHENVLSLRNFRDSVLSKSKWGQWFIDTYYQFSPRMAFFISERPLLKKLTRWVLTPVIYIIANPLWFMWAGLLLFGWAFWKFRGRGVMLLPLLFFIPTKSEAQFTQPSLFNSNFSPNPATAFPLNSKARVGYSQSTFDYEAEAANSSSAIDGGGGVLILGIPMADMGVQISSLLSNEFERTVEVDLLGESKDTFELTSNQINFQTGQYLGVLTGIQFIQSGQEEDYEGVDETISSESTSIGIGAATKVGEMFHAGGGVDYITSSGDEKADAKYIDAYLGIGIGNRAEGSGGYIAELGIHRSPEVVEVDGDDTFIKGESLTTLITLENELSVEGGILNSLIFALDYQTTTQAEVDSYIQEERKSTTTGISVGAKMLQKALHVIGGYSTTSEDFGSKGESTNISLALLYHFDGNFGTSP